jgi:hypothetical protein
MAWLKGFSKPKLIRNIFIIFFITGLWHGAAWHFVFWGLLNAVFFIPVIFGKRRKFKHPIAHNRKLPTLEEFFLMSRTFFIFTIVGIFFRCETITYSANMIWHTLSFSIFSFPILPEPQLLFVIPLFIVEWWQRSTEHGLDFSNRQIPTPIRWLVYLTIVASTLLYGGVEVEFIYFQF